ncbi:hypothetical protein IGI04_020684 [Brassica rapa subsp. trilocularis]|uniref:Uncharacterized protein n=1 Tax=Brassica rapa subsp. trilocularis TaxID=1813537 RepID=A0ABQ7MK88_BRACM|nr:hypothetical protein IGI04_020684 [Brassica rapa subsp. trilocularis]
MSSLATKFKVLFDNGVEGIYRPSLDNARLVNVSYVDTCLNPHHKNALSIRDPGAFAAARTNAAVPTSPSLRNNTGNQLSVHPDPPELTDSTPSPPQMSLTQTDDGRTKRSFYLSGTGTGVDGAGGASASRRQNQIVAQRASPRFPHYVRAFTPETDSPWTALFQSSGKAEEREDDSKAKIEGFKGGLRGSGDGTHAHAPAGLRTRL